MRRQNTLSVTCRVNASAYIPESDEHLFPKEDLDKLVTLKMTQALRPLGSIPADITVVISSEGAETDRVQKVSVKISFGKNRIASAAHARSIEKAIDRVVPDISRQARKYKTRRIDKSREDTARAKRAIARNRDFLLVVD